MSFQSLKKFLLFASGININIVSYDSMSPENRFSEENKYASIGASIILTSIVAFLSGSYALYTIFNSVLVSSSVGFIWGIKIFNLDRFVILSSRKKKNNFWADIIVIIPRLQAIINHDSKNEVRLCRLMENQGFKTHLGR